jgi:cyclopropane fatty-acyl-phospholipid synthase-like methyltransferase
MNFKKESFDRIFLTDVVEHLTDEELENVFNICLRLLRDNGKVIIHTAPTLNYLKIGQHIRKLFYCLKLKTFQTTTLQYEKKEKGHVNIQSKESLRKHLNIFPRVKCWYQFCLSENLIKKIIDKTPFAPYFALNLFAIASKK